MGGEPFMLRDAGNVGSHVWRPPPLHTHTPAPPLHILCGTLRTHLFFGLKTTMKMCQFFIY